MQREFGARAPRACLPVGRRSARMESCRNLFQLEGEAGNKLEVPERAGGETDRWQNRSEEERVCIPSPVLGAGPSLIQDMLRHTH